MGPCWPFGRLVTAALAGVLMGGVVAIAAPADEQRTFVTVSVNGQPAPDVVVVLGPPDIWLPYDYLDALGVRLAPGRQRIIEGRVHVALGSLLPTLTYQFDETTVSLALSVVPEAIIEQGVYSVGRQRPAGIERARNSSFFLNYAATARETSAAAYAGELGVSIRGALLSGSLTTDGDTLLRGPLRATLDHEARLVRLEVGDTVATSGSLGDGLDIAGVSVGRQFGINPYYVAQPPLRLRGSAATPSTADVYVNGQLVRRVPVAPGTFELTGITVPTGAGRTQVIVRDAFGREQQFATSFYQPLGVLQSGLHQFRYAVGVPRLGLSRQWDYGSQPVATGEHRYGVASRVTIGGRFEASPHFVSAGPGVALALPFGEMELQASASSLDGKFGTSGLFGYRYQARAFSAGIVAVAADRRYATLAATVFDRQRNRLSSQVFAGTSVGRFGLTAAHIISREWNGNRLERIDVVTSIRMTGRATLTVTTARNRFGRPRYESFASVSVGLGRNSVASINAARNAGDNIDSSVALQRSLGRGPGVGYQLQWSDRTRAARYGVATLQHRYGRVELRHDGFDSGGASATMSGAIVGAGGRLFATRPVTDAFALVRVPNQPHVRVYSSNQLIGRTNRDGDLIVPDVVSYYGNDLSIDPIDLPMTATTATSVALVAPSFRGGGLALFRITQMRPVVGRVVLTIAGRLVVPAHADIVAVDSSGARSPVGVDGSFFFDTLATGAMELAGRYKGRGFTCAVVVPPPGPHMVRDLGLVMCTLNDDATVPEARW